MRSIGEDRIQFKTANQRLRRARRLYAQFTYGYVMQNRFARQRRMQELAARATARGLYASNHKDTQFSLMSYWARVDLQKHYAKRVKKYSWRCLSRYDWWHTWRRDIFKAEPKTNSRVVRQTFAEYKKGAGLPIRVTQANGG